MTGRFASEHLHTAVEEGNPAKPYVADVQRILAEAMQELTPGIPIETEFLLADRWYKGADDQPHDE